MSMHLTIQQKLLAFSALGVAFVAAVGTGGWIATRGLAAASERITATGKALKVEMDADQDHDALRADVMAALLAGSAAQPDAAAEKAVRADLAEHAAGIRNAVKHLTTLSLQPASRVALEKVQAPLAAYLEKSASIVDLAFSDRAAAQAGMPAFDAAFKSLEKELGTLGDGIERDAEATEADGHDAATRAQYLLLATAAAAVLGLGVLGWLVGRGIVRPIQRAVRIAETVAEGDLRSRIDVDGHDEAAQLLRSLKRMNDNLGRVVESVRQGSDSIATGSGQIAAGNQDLSQRTEEQASNLQQTASSMAQLTTSVRQNAETTREAVSLAGSASEAATQGGAAVGQMVQTMSEISASSRRIGDIIGVIDGIAFQTNILALNAAVEAARAGEQGRGFAVVAAEVRSLAQRSALAAREIKGLIGASVEKVSDGSRQADEAGRTMEEIVERVRRVSQLIGDVGEANARQASGIEQVGDAISQLDLVTQQNAALVEESAAAAESLRTQSGALVAAVAAFRTA